MHSPDHSRCRNAASAAIVAAVSAFLVLSAGRAAPAQPSQPPSAQTGTAQPGSAAPEGRPGSAAPDLGLQRTLEPRAVELLKAMSERLAAAKTLSFTMVAAYESPARTGHPLLYMTRSDVTVQRPDKLRVVTPGDGPPSEFYYDGKTMTAYAPNEQLAAVAEAPPTIDGMLRAAYESAGIYFPFTDFIVADPYKDVEGDLKLAFVVGQSGVVGDTTTDIVAIASDTMQAQIWIGADDKLPRMMRATFFNDPGGFRHAAMFSDWRLDAPVPADAFTSATAATASRIAFSHPEAKAPEQQAGQR
ncbi:DUF2092 domain-containing protein [Azospirillum sp. sgz302134]